MLNKNIKLIALDVDGTIMDKNYRISDRVKKAISAAVEKGIYVLIATGRMYSATVPIAAELALKTPLIVYQGSLIKEFYNSDKTLLHHNIDKEIAYRIINDARQKDVQINVYLDDKLYVENNFPILQEYAIKRNISVYKLNRFEDVEDFFPTKILIMDSDADKTENLAREFKKKYSDELYITKSTDYFCEFVNKKCSKADGISFLAQKWNINQDEIMAIGDHENDIEMIEFAGLGVAMGNSHESVQKRADFITDTVDNDGAALAIEKFAL
ncbi:MAG TPA: Cof-type HAD-IIB family hydrolase [Candidatus Gastranaerophilales bacterium]|nr:Cof-type HAD-IIB family hydrolase [Candidatus Gastranaerophilales bacterium]